VTVDEMAVVPLAVAMVMVVVEVKVEENQLITP
jgi:hypothetical protein